MGKRRGVKIVGLILVAGILLCCGGLGITAVINHSMPTASAAPEGLSAVEKARLAEYFQLRQTLGNAVWSGWEDVVEPVVLYNERMVFLVGIPVQTVMLNAVKHPDPHIGYFVSLRRT